MAIISTFMVICTPSFGANLSCEALLQRINPFKMFKPKDIESTYVVDHLDSQVVNDNLFDIFNAFRNGLEPDLSKSNERTLFEAYLRSQFGDPSRTDIGASLDNIALHYSERYLQKPQFYRAQIKIQTKTASISDGLTAYTQSLLRMVGKAKGPLLEIEANIGYWSRLLKLKSIEYQEQERIQLIDRLNLFISQNERDQIRDSSLAPRARIEILFRFLQRASKNMTDEKSIKEMNKNILNAISLVGFLDPLFSEKIHSEDALVRIQAMQNLLNRRDELAIALGFSGHFEEALKKHDPKGGTLILKNNLEMTKDLEKFTNEAKLAAEGKIKEESFVIRQLSIAESSFRSCIGGSDCSSNTYLNLALHSRFVYFTMLNQDGLPDGHITLAIGHAGYRNVAFIDKIQNVNLERIPFFVEAVRRVVEKSGIILALSKVEKMDHNGLSNDEAIIIHVKDGIERSRIPMGRFVLSGTEGLFNMYSRAFSRPFVYRVLPLKESGYQIELMPSPKPYRISNDVSASKILMDSRNLINGTEEDKIKFFALADTLIRLNIVTKQEYKSAFQSTILDAKIGLSVKYKAFYYRLKSISYISEDIDSLIDLILQMNPKDSLQIYSQLKQRKDMQNLNKILWFAFLDNNPKHLKKFIDTINNGELFKLTAADNNVLKARQLANEKMIVSAPKIVVEASQKSKMRSLKEIVSDLLKQEDISFSRAFEIGYWLSEAVQPRYVDEIILDQIHDHELRRMLSANLRRVSPYFAKSLEDNSRFKSCFPAGLKVSSLEGVTPIERIEVGTKVLSFNDRHEMEWRQVEQVFIHYDRTLVELELENGVVVVATPEHPFYSPQYNEYRMMSELFAGDAVAVFQNGQLVPVNIRSIRSIKDKATVYNFSVEKNHNYFIEGVLVHNIKDVF